MWAEQVIASLAGVGLNAAGVAGGEPGRELLPGCRSILVFASGGAALWDAFLADARAHPEHLTASRHPLDDFVARRIALADPDPPPTRRWIRCAAEPEAFLDFRPLALAAGLGWHSRLGLLLHPEFGPWIGLRAACLTTEELPLSAPLPGGGPCDSCPAPCAAACPGGAFPDGAMNIRRCAAFHLESTRCHGRCDARRACPEGAAHRHGDLQHHYHYARGTGRELLAEALGITGDAHRGIDPRWKEWGS